MAEELAHEATRDLRDVKEKLDKVEPGLDELRKQLQDLAAQIQASSSTHSRTLIPGKQ